MSKRQILFSTFRWLVIAAGLALGGSACGAPPPETPAPPTIEASAAGLAAAIPPTLAPRPTPTATLAPTPTASLMPPACSPFPGYTQAELLAAISNPYNPPPPGSDDPHQAIDLAVVQHGMAQAGAPVQVVLAGRVALVIHNRFPYGYAVLIETPLAGLPPQALPAAWLPTPAPTLAPHPVLTCPPVSLRMEASGARSLYLLYAHLEAEPPVQPGQALGCGAPLGRVGQSGNALNPHLHLEARLGPSGAQFDGMAHYDSTATAAEMGAYCLWRVSNLFQLVDPHSLLSTLP